MKYDTIKEACEAWIHEMSAIPQSLVKKAYLRDDFDGITEVTPPSICDRVYHFESGECGEIDSYNEDKDNYIITLDNGESVTANEDDFEVQRDDYLPMWGTMWMFGDSADDYWLEDMDGIRQMAECGFRIYKVEEGYIFGIDGAGYSFYKEHWIPLYKARGLHWHKEESED
jgi:hypothetical protein